jgi:predicted lipid-binding transport protein (Tim44 family)
MGNGVPFLDIILLALFAGFVIFKLRSVLGRRTGHERRRPDPFSESSQSNDNGNVVRLPDRSADSAEAQEEAEASPDSMAAGVMRIKLADESFDEREFIQGAKSAFGMIVEAYAKGDVDALRPLLSRELYGGFASAIEAREKAGEVQETTIVSIRSADIVDASLENYQAKVTVEFVTEQVKVTRDAEGEVTEGDPDRIDILTDIWTFARDIRSRDPNWELVATRVPED